MARHITRATNRPDIREQRMHYRNIETRDLRNRRSPYTGSIEMRAPVLASILPSPETGEGDTGCACCAPPKLRSGLAVVILRLTYYAKSTVQSKKDTPNPSVV